MTDREGAAPTIDDVARDAGVSAMTVSRVFSGIAAVSQEKREAVLRSAQKLRYVPNRSAQILASADASRAQRARLRLAQAGASRSSGPILSGELLGLALKRCFDRGRVVPLRQLRKCLASEGLDVAEAEGHLERLNLIRVTGEHAVLSERGRTLVAHVTERLTDIAELVADIGELPTAETSRPLA